MWEEIQSQDKVDMNPAAQNCHMGMITYDVKKIVKAPMIGHLVNTTIVVSTDKERWNQSTKVLHVVNAGNRCQPLSYISKYR